MIIKKRPDGTVEYSGVAFEILDYNAKALGIRKVIRLQHLNKINFTCQ